MNLSNLASIGSFVSGVAVVASLVFLYFQVRQLNVQAKQAAISQQAMMKLARTTRVMEVNERMASEAFAQMDMRIARNGKDVSAVDVMRFSAHARAVFQNGEDTFAQHRRGLVHPADFTSFEKSFRWGLQSPQLRLAWGRHRMMYDEGYVSFVDRLVSEAPLMLASPDMLERWQAEMAAAIASAGGASPPAAKPRPRRRSAAAKPIEGLETPLGHPRPDPG
ncbi:hypothetical protein [Phenylobacterium sp.]|jgi:hypothetical protein|uniref:hypothetical protein n=1 Tax=Phenylobacterium sp. TaxID=1871053 RepID=UPI002F3F4C36